MNPLMLVFVRRIAWLMLVAEFLATPLLGQAKRLWILSPPGELVEYDPATFAVKQKTKVPTEALKSPSGLTVNHLGQVLFTAPVSLPLSESDIANPHKVWFWNGQAASSVDRGVQHSSEDHGSNQAVTESAPVPYLSADGTHLFWFANQTRRLQREEVDLSLTNTLLVWQTDLEGKAREDIATTKLPDCRCSTGTCEESCPFFVTWVPEGGVQNFFLSTQFVAGQTATSYKSSARYQLDAGKWTANPMSDPVQRMLDANSSGSVIVEAIPDTGCCGWSNQSNDQTLVLVDGNAHTVFDERETYKNPDYDVSFYTSNARLSPDAGQVAMTIATTGQSNKPIQVSEEGEASPEEAQRIRKAMLDLPAIEIKTVDDNPRRIGFLPHAVLVGWLNNNELLIIENHLLVAYNVGKGTRRKSLIRVDESGRVYLR